MNFRNQAKVWEVEQQRYEEEKRRADAKVWAGSRGQGSGAEHCDEQTRTESPGVLAAHMTGADTIRRHPQAEFEAEQEYLKTLSMLSPQEEERYRQRQVCHGGEEEGREGGLLFPF